MNKLRSNKKNEWFGALGSLFVFAVVAALLFYVVPMLLPLLRIRGIQTPVNVTKRDGVLSSYVLRIQNLSRDTLAEVRVTAGRPGVSQEATTTIESIAPGAYAELGALQWKWELQPGDTVSVRGSGYLPIVFNP